jgi:hypothetical protein
VRVADVLNQIPLNFNFTRVLRDARWDAWMSLVEWLMGVQLTDQPDVFSWNLTASRKFSAIH